MYVKLLNSQLHVWMLPIVLFLSSIARLLCYLFINLLVHVVQLLLLNYSLFCCSCQPKSKQLIVAADFNIENFSISKEYKNMLNDFCLTIHEPSRVCCGSATLIGYISSLLFTPVTRQLDWANYYIRSYNMWI